MAFVRSATLLLTLALLAAPATAADPPRPPAPSPTIPALNESRVVAVCVECDEPFDTATHKLILEGLVSNPYVGELRKALYQQDILHQFESKAHFDNCDFDGAMDYIVSLLDEADRHVATGKGAIASGDSQLALKAHKGAFFSIGQAMHAVQDFYAHTNYVELTAPKAQKATDMRVIKVWTKDGRAHVKQLQSEGLISGYVFWGFPQKCPSGSPSHADLAKDSETTPSGKKLNPNLQNLNNYRVAVFLAREASVVLLRDCFARWPTLKKANGPNAAFEVLLDRRGL